MGLTDYDERMAVLIQKVEGQRYGRYFFPSLSGVGFSHNPYRWSKRIRREDGLLRIVAGLGTRAVERVSQDYPRMVALSHPELRPERGAGMLRRYSQHQIDVIDLEANALVTLPVTEVMDIGYPGLGAIISVDQGGFIQPLSGRPLSLSPDQMVVTFDSLLAREEFVGVMREMLVVLEEAYKRPVDIEFAVEVTKTYPRPELDIVLLQCRSLSQRRGGQVGEWPSDVPEEDILFTAADQVPDGAVTGIRYIVYVDPHVYARIPDPSTRIQLGQVIGRINQALGEDCFILMGPGRWGTSNIQLGVKVTYADIYNTKVLIEVAHADGGSIPEVSYGTHFFQDLVEANIYPLPIYPDDPAVIYRENFLLESPNVLPDILPGDGQYQSYVKVIDVQAVTGRLLHVVMDAEQDKAIAYFKDNAKCG
jgi:pyruvate,water dikinase